MRLSRVGGTVMNLFYSLSMSGSARGPVTGPYAPLPDKEDLKMSWFRKLFRSDKPATIFGTERPEKSVVQPQKDSTATASSTPLTDSIMSGLMAGITQIDTEFKLAFVQLLGQVAPLVSDPLRLKDGDIPEDTITWDNSEDLREATRLTDSPATRKQGIERLQELCQLFPESAAPYTLLAQALRYDGEYDQAEKLLVNALPNVSAKSEILDMLGNIFNYKEDHAKATAYYLLAAYAAGPKFREWGTYIYLYGIYQACKQEERAKDCYEIAAWMRGGNPVNLTSDKIASIRQAVASNPIICELANRAWPSICDKRELFQQSQSATAAHVSSEPALDSEPAEQPFLRRNPGESWEDFVAEKMIQGLAGTPTPELCLRCQTTVMAEALLRLRPSSTNRFLHEQPLLIEYSDNTAAAVFELESGSNMEAFVDELFGGSYGEQNVVVINGIAVGASEKKTLLDKLCAPQGLSMGNVITW